MKIRYKLQELINDDQHASLWLSKLHLDEEVKDHLVVVKSLKIQPSQFKYAEHFQERANAFLHLKHPSLTSLYDFGLMRGCFYVTQEYVEGFSLQQLLDALSSKRIHLPLWFILPIIYSIIQGVKAIHSNNKLLNPQRIEPILRLTPSKIIITSKGLVKMIESGIFTPFLNDTDDSRKKNYQAPEISCQPVPDQRSDIYSLGAVFFECVTGASPTKDSNLQQIASEHSWIPTEILTVFEKSIDQNPDKRFLNLDEFGFAIGNFIKYFDQKITHIELVNLLSILFPDSTHLSSSRKQIDTWFKTTEKKDPEKYAWITAFSQMYQNLNSSSTTTFVNPMQHFYLAPLEKSSQKNSVSILGLPKGTAIQPLLGIGRQLSLVSQSEQTNIKMPQCKFDNTDKQEDHNSTKVDYPNVFKTFKTPDNNNSSKIDPWVSTRTLRLSGLKLDIEENKPGYTSKSTIFKKSPEDTFLKTASEINNNFNIGETSFELGFAALKSKDYTTALKLFEEALLKEPDNKILEINIKQVKKFIKNTH
jgi:hypothetical protein